MSFKHIIYPVMTDWQRGASLAVLFVSTLIMVTAPTVSAITAEDLRSIQLNKAQYKKDDSTSCTPSTTTANVDSTALGSTLPPESEKIFQQIKPAIDKLQPAYEQAGQAKGVPWQMIAAIHHRESGNNPTTSILNGQPLGQQNIDHPDLQVATTIEASAEQAAEYIKNLALSSYGVKVSSSNSFAELQEIFVAYNRGVSYKQAGVSPDKSPYVMNGYDAQHMHMSWVGPPADPSSSGVDGDLLGALTVYSALVGDVSSGSACSTGDGTSSGGLGVSSDGFTFPQITTKAAIKKGSGFVWCYTSKTSCHHDYWAADIANAEGTTNVVAKGGTVIEAVDPGSCSGFDVPRVHIKADDGLYYYYTHMRVGSLEVRKGQTVKAGDPIGKIGPSECAEGTSPHLHFQITKQVINDTGSMSGQYYCSGGADHMGKIDGDPCYGTKTVFNLNPQPPLVETYNKLPDN